MIVREATATDAARLVELIAQLDFEVDASGIEERLGSLARQGEPLLVVEIGGSVEGCLDWHVMTTIHRPYKVGRIVMLVVDEESRGRRLGTAMVEEAERRMKSSGCELIEVTSNHRLEQAHRYYESLGFVETSKRFGKKL